MPGWCVTEVSGALFAVVERWVRYCRYPRGAQQGVICLWHIAVARSQSAGGSTASCTLHSPNKRHYPIMAFHHYITHPISNRRPSRPPIHTGHTRKPLGRRRHARPAVRLPRPLAPGPCRTAGGPHRPTGRPLVGEQEPGGVRQGAGAPGVSGGGRGWGYA